ncbi:lysine-specific histone demethylase 1 homolog 3 [Typha angustifolia]|uniref:lysine-specific histone demethylase 1 homolog 3 n=1 Tax=Typha angustifolia TaxID=59011 RepID=UPI003C301DC3
MGGDDVGKEEKRKLEGESDDDERPIWSMFKLKKSHPSWKGKMRDSGVRAEKDPENEEISGEINDTLAIIKKKLKRPKRAKEVDGAGSGLGPNSLPLDRVGVSVQVEDAGVDMGLEHVVKPKRGRPRRASRKKDEETRDAGVHQGFDSSPDLGLKESLSALVKRAQSSSVRRSHQVSKKQVERTTTSDVIKQSSDKVSNDLCPPVIRDTLRSVVDSFSPSDGVSKGMVSRKRGRKPHDDYAERTMEVNTQDGDEIIEEQSTIVRKTSSSVRQNGRVEDQSSIQGSSRYPSRTAVESISDSSQEFIHPILKPDMENLEIDGDFCRPSEGSLDISAPLSIQAYSSGSVLETKEKPEGTEVGSLDLNIEKENKSAQTSYNSSEEILPYQVNDGQKLEDASNHCSSGSITHFKVPSWKFDGSGLRPCSAEIIERSILAPCTEAICIPSDRNQVLVHGPSSAQAFRTPDESSAFGNSINQTTDGFCEVNPSLQMLRRKDIDRVDGSWTEESNRKSIMIKNGLNFPSKEEFEKPSVEVADCDKLLRQPPLNFDESLPKFLAKKSKSPAQDGVDCVFHCDDELAKQDDGLSQGLAMSDHDNEKLDFQDNSNDAVNQSTKIVSESARSQLMHVMLPMEEKLACHGLLLSSPVNICDVTQQIANESTVSSTTNWKSLAAADASLDQFVRGTKLVNQSVTDAFKEPSPPVVIKDRAVCSQTNVLYTNENNQIDASIQSDNTDNQSIVPRTLRSTKRRRHDDMAYEGDVDWEILMCEQGVCTNTYADYVDRSVKLKDKPNFDIHSLVLEDASNGGTAAVAAGLKAQAVTPIEKIKFKDVIKRKGGLQEYLECRNLILSRWSKNVKCILPIADCGISDAPLEDESPRESLIRQIYLFLDRNGYINAGIASEKGIAKIDGALHFQVSKEFELKECCVVKADSVKNEVASVSGEVKLHGNATKVENSTSFNVQKTNFSLEEESIVRKNLPVAGTGLELSSQVISKEYAFGDMRIDVQSTVARCGPAPFSTDDAKSECCPKSFAAYPDDQNILGNVMHGQETMLSHGAHISNSTLKITDDEPDKIEDSFNVDQPVATEREPSAYNRKASAIAESDSKTCKRIIIVGAGPAGLTAGRHLLRQGFSVTVLEARDRIGGRVCTDRTSLSVPVDLGASIITGVEADVATERRPDPSSLICNQLGLELTVLNSDCPLYDIVTGHKVPADLDEALEAEYNSLLDDMVLLVAQNGDGVMGLSLEDGLEYDLRKRHTARSSSPGAECDQFKTIRDSGILGSSMCAQADSGMISGAENDKIDVLSPFERRVMNWHFAHLEYGCAAMLKEVSLPYWNQDDVYGGFGGAHCMIKGGYSTVVESLGKGLDIHLKHIVTQITYETAESGDIVHDRNKVKVCTSNGSEFMGDAVLITVPLGCLKSETIKFSPALPDWKQSSISRLGFGVLNKVVLEFPKVFWDDTVDYFGATAEETGSRGQCFMFWNVRKTVGAPVLIALVVGKAAIDGQNISSADHVNHALMILRKLFGKDSVPDPVASVVTNWGADPFSRGAYSFVAVGASGEDYDILGRPVANCLFFAGEATCKEHPDTVGGAMLSGLREAVRIIDVLCTGKDYVAEVEAIEAVQRRSDSEKNEVREISKRLEVCKLSSALCKSSSDAMHTLVSREALLQEIFSSAKTTSGRLHLAKELLRLPVEVLKSFAGTREGLSMLNSWILDSLGKNATQLLRHCVRLLVLVSTDLLAVRLSGIGRTVKEKVCMHTSRDIRAIASQLVSMWIEVLRKEKASNGGLKLLKHVPVSQSTKIKTKDLLPAKIPSRMSSEISDCKGTTQIPKSAGSHSPSRTNNKKSDSRTTKLEALTDTKSEASSVRSQRTTQGLESEVDHNTDMSGEEAAAYAAAEAARAAAIALAEAYASSEAEVTASHELPKIPSFHKFARREQYQQMDESDLRRRLSGGNFGRQDCISEIDSRNCKVRNWSVDFTATCANLDGSRMSGDKRSYSNEMTCPLNLREHSGESAAIDSRLTRAWIDTDVTGSGCVKDSLAIERWQSQAMDAGAEFYNQIHIPDEEDSNEVFMLHTVKHQRQSGGSSVSQVAESKPASEGRSRGVDCIKQGVLDYVASLLMPLYKTRKIDREGYKAIMKKTVTKVMEQCTEAEKMMAVYEFLDFKRKNKIRSFVDKLIERHMQVNQTSKY